MNSNYHISLFLTIILLCYIITAEYETQFAVCALINLHFGSLLVILLIFLSFLFVVLSLGLSLPLSQPYFSKKKFSMLIVIFAHKQSDILQVTEIFIVRYHLIINGREVLRSIIGTLQNFTYLRVIYLETSNILRRHKDQNVSVGLLGQPGILAVSQSRWCRPSLGRVRSQDSWI